MRTYIGFILLSALLSGISLSQNSWEFRGGPYYGAATALATNTDGHIFAGTATGIFRSKDEGNNWSWVTKELGILNANAIVIKPNKNIFAGLSDGRILRSTSNGDNWEFVSSGLPGNSITALAYKGDDTLFAGTDSAGVYRSSSNGDLWTAVNQGLLNLKIRTLVIKSNGDIYSGTENGIYRSTNNGEHWDTLQGTSGCQVSKIAFDFQSNIFTVFSSGSTPNRLFKSTNNGNAWKILSMDSMIERFHPTTVAIDSDGNIIANDIVGPYGIDSVLFCSTNSGDSWTSILINNPNRRNIGFIILPIASFGDSLYVGQIISITVNSNGRLYVGSSKGGILRLQKNSTKWDFLNRNFESKPIYSMAAKADSDVYLYSDGGLLHSLQTDSSWELLSLRINSNPSGLAIHPNGNIFYAWDPRGIDQYAVTTIAINPNRYIYQGGYLSPYLFRSINDGRDWDHLPAAYCSTLVAGATERMYGFSGPTGRDDCVIRSSDYGISWSGIGRGIPNGDLIISYNSIYGLAENNHGDVFVGTDFGVYRKRNGDTTWVSVNTGLPLVKRMLISYPDTLVGYYSPVYALMKNSLDNIFIGTSRGMFCSTNDGDAWIEFNQGLPPGTTINNLAIDTLGYLYAGTSYGGVFKTLQITVSVSELPINIPTKFSLEQNYPNPFNPMTVIRYTIPQVGTQHAVSLRVYDLLGREVATLVNATEEAGPHAVTWNAQVATGVYFYRLVATSVKDPSKRFTETKKMLLLR
jgi:ligand-binding sensor domain-containing protein